MKAAIYARVSTVDQNVENQFGELRQYVQARKWQSVEYADAGVSGTKESRPALDKLLKDARRRKFDVLVVWRLDRLGRNLKHLLMVIDELHALGIAFVSLHEGIDATTPAGRLQLQIIGMFAEFERNRLIERVKAGMTRAKKDGIHVGRPKLRGWACRSLRSIVVDAPPESAGEPQSAICQTTQAPRIETA
jgi:DNA invertase Pin-like site-specific DNA recombinase